MRDAAVVFRLWNYRHQVAHRGANPFMFTIQLGGPTDGARGAHLLVDPRDPGGVHVSREARDDLEAMVELAERRLRATFDRLQACSVR